MGITNQSDEAREPRSDQQRKENPTQQDFVNNTNASLSRPFIPALPHSSCSNPSQNPMYDRNASMQCMHADMLQCAKSNVLCRDISSKCRKTGIESQKRFKTRNE